MRYISKEVCRVFVLGRENVVFLPERQFRKNSLNIFTNRKNCGIIIVPNKTK